MLSTKSKDLSQAARWFHALADETRLRIIDCLLECEQCVCDLTDSLQMGQSRLSFHLKTLKDAGLLKDRREGRWIYYSLNPDTIGELQEILAAISSRRGRVGETSRCCD
ncbi:MAG: ArsR/SmtB family transcription factor [Candidatus Methylomirabilis sp.]